MRVLTECGDTSPWHQSVCIALSSLSHSEARRLLAAVVTNASLQGTDVSQLICMTDQELEAGAPEEKYERGERIAYDTFRTLVDAVGSNTATAACSKCGSADGMTIITKQTRGGDEGSTHFTQCDACSDRIRIE